MCVCHLHRVLLKKLRVSHVLVYLWLQEARGIWRRCYPSSGFPFFKSQLFLMEIPENLELDGSLLCDLFNDLNGSLCIPWEGSQRRNVNLFHAGWTDTLQPRLSLGKKLRQSREATRQIMMLREGRRAGSSWRVTYYPSRWWESKPTFIRMIQNHDSSVSSSYLGLVSRWTIKNKWSAYHK